MPDFDPEELVRNIASLIRPQVMNLWDIRLKTTIDGKVNLTAYGSNNS